MTDFLTTHISTHLANYLRQTPFQLAIITLFPEKKIYSSNSPQTTPDFGTLVKTIQNNPNNYLAGHQLRIDHCPECFWVPLTVLDEVQGYLIIGSVPEELHSEQVLIRSADLLQLGISLAIRQILSRLAQKIWKSDLTIIGIDPAFTRSFNVIEQFSQSGNPVLITGSSGVGKELFAKAIYLLSSRFGQPLITVNCGQFQDEHLLISELFGHKKGSFTGATADRRGVFETANGGVIVLDEIGELSLEAQKMLLRVIEYGEIRPLGAEKTILVNTRVISATHRNLDQMVNEGRFREDLYYRLNVLPIHVPSLHERGQDELLLLQYFLHNLNQERGVKKEFAPEVLDFIRDYPFHGNVRELKNIVESGFWLSRQNIISLSDMTTRVRQTRRRRTDDFFSTEVAEYYYAMVDGGKDFWEVIRGPFLNRDLNRAQVKAVIREGMKTARTYKELLPIFNIAEPDYKRFLNFINEHQLN